MCYAHMLFRGPDWVRQLARQLSARVTRPLLPSIEVRESYRQEELTDAFFEQALGAALDPPSSGVVFWSWPALEQEANKREILSRRAR
jgi:hypothetical protein